MASTTGSAHPLFSIAATSALLVFLYTPRPLLHFLLSPALIASLLCLTALLFFSSTHQQPPISPTPKPPEPHINFLEFSGPLEVIYEEYEGEEEDDSRDSDHSEALIDRMRSTGMCYADSSNSDSDDDDDYLPENMCYRWEEEAEGMIEIELEDENLIEIDISGGGRRSPAGWGLAV